MPVIHSSSLPICIERDFLGTYRALPGALGAVTIWRGGRWAAFASAVRKRIAEMFDRFKMVCLNGVEPSLPRDGTKPALVLVTPRPQS